MRCGRPANAAMLDDEATRQQPAPQLALPWEPEQRSDVGTIAAMATAQRGRAAARQSFKRSHRGRQTSVSAVMSLDAMTGQLIFIYFFSNVQPVSQQDDNVPGHSDAVCSSGCSGPSKSPHGPSIWLLHEQTTLVQMHHSLFISEQPKRPSVGMRQRSRPRQVASTKFIASVNDPTCQRQMPARAPVASA